MLNNEWAKGGKAFNRIVGKPRQRTETQLNRKFSNMVNETYSTTVKRKSGILKQLIRRAKIVYKTISSQTGIMTNSEDEFDMNEINSKSKKFEAEIAGKKRRIERNNHVKRKKLVHSRPRFSKGMQP